MKNIYDHMMFTCIIVVCGVGVGIFSFRLIENIESENHSLHIFMVVTGLVIAVTSWIDWKNKLKQTK